MRGWHWLLALCVAVLPATAMAQVACSVQMGPGWPAAMTNYGQGAARLLGGEHTQGISLLSLPKRGEETQLTLLPADGGQWLVIQAAADERIHHVYSNRTGFGVELRLEQTPRIDSAPIPADLAGRIVAHWEHFIGQASLLAQPPLIDREDAVSLSINGQRYSGRAPGCAAFERLQAINLQLLELAGSKEKKHEKRHEAIARALEKYEERLAAGKI